MTLVHLVILLALVQYIAFLVVVGKARGTYGVSAPATTGHPEFEKRYRVQMNTLELMVIFTPAILIAASYWSPNIMAGLGLVYLIGRIVYFRAYVADPARRTTGFGLSIFPIFIMILAAFAGVVKGLM